MEDEHEYTESTRIIARCESPVRTFPGCYLYTYAQGGMFRWRVFDSVPLTVMRSEDIAIGKKDTATGTELHFLISKRSHLLRSSNTKLGRQLLLDGPYGQKMYAESFLCVFLMAQGTGITALLPFALDLLDKMKTAPEKTSTRRVNILWSLECTSQIELAGKDLKYLQEHDKNSVSTRNRNMVAEEADY